LPDYNSFFVKYANFNDKKHNFNLVVEFVMYLRKNDKVVDISCGYCSIPITKYATTTASNSRIKEKIVGGSPQRTININ